MKNIKIYSYPYTYVKHFFEERDILIIEDVFDVTIKITREDFDSISVLSNGNVIAEYEDNGETIRYLKGLGKIIMVSYIASCLFDFSSFFIKDKSSYKYGISKISSLGRTYILFGGYSGPTDIIDITGMSKESIKNITCEKILSDYMKYKFIDFKSMKIFISKEVASYTNSSLFEKPYIFVE